MKTGARLLAGAALAIGITAAAAPAASAAGPNAPQRALQAQPAALGGSCAATPSAGGDWPAYGQGLNGDRLQPAEKTLGPGQAPTLSPKWTLTLSELNGAPGAIFNGTPTEAGGCIFVGTSSGSTTGGASAPSGPAEYDVYAVNADTGKPVWHVQLPTDAPGLLGTGVVGSVVADMSAGLVFAEVSSLDDPYTAAIDAHTGRVVWATQLDNRCGAYADASPVVFNGLVLSGFNNDESQDCADGGYDVLDEYTGAVIDHVQTVPAAAYAKGYRGGSIWATAAVDTRTGYAYVGTGNGASPENDDYPTTDAILKIDLNRGHSTFGQIVGYYEGTPDNLPADVTGAPAYTPVCTVAGPAVQPYVNDVTGPSSGAIVAMAECLDGDQDFGASPQLFTIKGRPVVGELQKSGVYHAAYADTMKGAWTTRIGTLCVICNADTAATDGKSIYVEGTPPGNLYALNASNGQIEWATPVGDVIHFEAVTEADGVLYTVDSTGAVDAFDAATGVPLWKRMIGQDNGGSYGSSFGDLAGSVSVARHTVYVSSGLLLAGYRPTGSVPVPATRKAGLALIRREQRRRSHR